MSAVGRIHGHLPSRSEGLNCPVSDLILHVSLQLFHVNLCRDTRFVDSHPGDACTGADSLPEGRYYGVFFWFDGSLSDVPLLQSVAKVVDPGQSVSLLLGAGFLYSRF